MPIQSPGALILFAFMVLALTLGFVCHRPKLAFYGSLLLGLATCGFLFSLGIAVELGGLAHVIPFAFISWLISRHRGRARN